MDRILAARPRGGSIIDDVERLCAPAQAAPSRLKSRAGRAGGRLQRLGRNRVSFHSAEPSMPACHEWPYKAILFRRLGRPSEL